MQKELSSSFREIRDPFGSDAHVLLARLATFDEDHVPAEVIATDGKEPNGVTSASAPHQAVEPFSHSYKIAVAKISDESQDKSAVLVMDTDSQILIDHAPYSSGDAPDDQWVAPFSDSDDLDVRVEGDAPGGYCIEDTPLEKTKAGMQESENSTPVVFRTPGDILRNAALTIHAAVRITRAERLKRRAKWASKKLLVFILSHVGLTTIVGLYAVAGGFLFQYLEGQKPLEDAPVVQTRELLKINFTEIRQRHIDMLWNFTQEINILYPSDWKRKCEEILLAFQNDLTEAAVTTEEILVPEPLPVAAKWTYPSALLYSVTIITTIGYGDTVPVTLEGKVASMLYALIGIPLVLLCLTNIGSFLAMTFRFTWKHTTHLGHFLVQSPKRNEPMVKTSEVRVPITVSVLTMFIYILSGAIIFSRWENWTFLDGYYFCFITLSTIGFGDFVPGKNTQTLDSNAKRVVCALYLLFGLALLSMIFQLIQDTITVISRRYASFLGLSEKQIEREMEESKDCSDEAEGKARNVPDDTGCSGDAKTPLSQRRNLVPQRRESCPVPKQEPLFNEPLTRMYSVPSDTLTRQLRLLKNKQLLARGGLHPVEERTAELSHESLHKGENVDNIKDQLYQKYSIASNGEELQDQ
ncbi:potassium channel subfamily K member 9 [Biomphalaria glabrata]|nr:potassium channel subfamily K member 9 [Biomphalaria glabrata]